MRIPTKYLFYDGLPNAKDVNKLMADNGYSSLPQVDRRNYKRNDVFTSIAPPNQPIDDRYTPLNPSNSSRNLPQVDNSNYGPINAPGSINPSSLNSLNLQLPNSGTTINQNPNNFGDYFNTGLGLVDSLIPGERIHNNYVTQPLPVYNPYPYGTGSQAIMEDGGYVYNSGECISALTETAKSGWLSGAVNPAHKGYCTPMTKSTCTPRRKAFAMRAKHHNLADGGELYEEHHRDSELESHLLNALSMIRKSKGDDTDDSDTAYSGIHIKPENKGKFTAYKKRTGKTTEEALHSKDPHVRQMANFARNAKKFHHKKGKDGYELYSPSMESGGGLSRSEDYGSKSHPYPGVSQEDFAGPHRSYPIPTKADAVDALRLAHLHHNQSVISKVHKKYPNLEEGGLIPYNPQTYESGGSLSPEKAKEILRDGTANGHKLTAKQKRFFGAVAGGAKPKAPDGTTLPKAPPGMKQTGSLPPTPPERTDAYLLDDINQVLASGQHTTNTGYSPEQQALLQDAYIWRNSNSFHRNPNIQQNIQAYFDRPIDTNNPLHMLRARLSKIGGGPLAMYNTTPNLDVRAAVPNNTIPQQTVATTMEGGGFVAGSIHDLSEEEIARMLKAGYKFENFTD